jgi:hypothetical protein
MDTKIEMPTIKGFSTGFYQLDQEEYELTVAVGDRQHKITVLKGFTFDGASIPRALWRLCGHPFEVPRVAAGLVHDWLYAARVTSRGDADAVYRNVLIVTGWGRFSAWSEWAALRLFGWAAWRSSDANDRDHARSYGCHRQYTVNKED